MRVEHITGRFFRNDAVVDAVPFVYGVPVVAGSGSRVGLDRACVATLRNTRTREIHTQLNKMTANSCRTGLDRRPAECGQNRPCWTDPGFRT